MLVKESASLNEAHILRDALLKSISTPYMWDINQNNLHIQDQLVQTCIIFFSGDIDVELDVAWSKDVFSEEHRRLSGRLLFTTRFVDLRQPDSVDLMLGDNKVIHHLTNRDISVVGTVEIESTGYPLTAYIHVHEVYRCQDPFVQSETDD